MSTSKEQLIEQLTQEHNALAQQLDALRMQEEDILVKLRLHKRYVRLLAKQAELKQTKQQLEDLSALLNLLLGDIHSGSKGGLRVLGAKGGS